MSTTETQDPWSSWLLKRRHGGDADCQRMTMEGMRMIRDKVLKNAMLKPGETLLDVGTGDGLIGFGAVEKVGADGRVIFSDISEQLLGVCKECATELGILERCDFINANAIDLSAIPFESVDVVTTRSVIIYVAEKQKALNEFFRVLRPGGRVSMFEPINKLNSEYVGEGNYLGYDVLPIKDLMEKIAEAHKVQREATNTMGDFDERDLVKMFQRAGFQLIELKLHVTVANGGVHRGSWESFYHSAPNPLVPTFREQVESALSPDEQARFIAHLQPLVESGDAHLGETRAFVTALKR